MNTRQKEAIEQSMKNLEDVSDLLKDCCFLDAVSVSLELAIDNLLELTGKKTSEVVIEEIFSKFCVGK